MSRNSEHQNSSLFARITSGYSAVTEYFERIEDYLAFFPQVALFMILVVIVVNVAGRYIFNLPLPNTIDYVELYLMPVVLFMYLSVLDRNDGNVGVGVVRNKMSESKKLLVDLPVAVCVIYLLYMIGSLALDRGLTALERGQTTGVYDMLPKWVTWIIITLGCLMLILRMVLNIIDMSYQLVLDVQSRIQVGGDDQ